MLTVFTLSASHSVSYPFLPFKLILLTSSLFSPQLSLLAFTHIFALSLQSHPFTRILTIKPSKVSRCIPFHSLVCSALVSPELVCLCPLLCFSRASFESDFACSSYIKLLPLPLLVRDSRSTQVLIAISNGTLTPPENGPASTLTS